jgi:hypothetical protein
MFEATFEHWGSSFGIIVDDWGDSQGAKTASAALERMVRELDILRVKALHRDLLKSDSAFGDEPIFDSAAMIGLNQARLAALNAGMYASDENLNEGHSCELRLVAIG